MLHSRAHHQARALFGLFALTFVLLVAHAVPADAQVAGRQWELGFGLGSANVESSSEDFDLDFRQEVRAAYMLSDHVQIDGQLMIASAIFDASLQTAMVNGVYNFQPDQGFVPYALAGVGYYELDDVSFLGLGEDISEDSTAYQVGIGGRYYVGSEKHMAIRLELSSLWLDTDLFDSDRFTSLTGGLTWSFGRR